jgi:antitoxin (DNA-binding transcriptional repressor) of toxin-antitoxin stability system
MTSEVAMNTVVVRRGTPGYASDMATPDDRSTDISVRQFVADSGSVTRGLRQGRSYTLTLNGEPLARMIPIRRRRAVPKEEVLAIFATAPAIDADELRADLDGFLDQEARDPFEGTGL